MLITQYEISLTNSVGVPIRSKVFWSFILMIGELNEIGKVGKDPSDDILTVRKRVANINKQVAISVMEKDDPTDEEVQEYMIGTYAYPFHKTVNIIEEDMGTTQRVRDICQELQSRHGVPFGRYTFPTHESGKIGLDHEDYFCLRIGNAPTNGLLYIPDIDIVVPDSEDEMYAMYVSPRAGVIDPGKDIQAAADEIEQIIYDHFIAI